MRKILSINGNGESIAYSIGQIFYQKVQSGDIFISEGVQQPYELNTASILTTDYNIQISIHPNPTSENIIIRSDNMPIDEFRIRLFDLDGRVLLDRCIKELQHEIDLNYFPNASYQLIISNSSNETILSTKIIKI
jgi:hypothetical protein